MSLERGLCVHRLFSLSLLSLSLCVCVRACVCITYQFINVLVSCFRIVLTAYHRKSHMWLHKRETTRVAALAAQLCLAIRGQDPGNRDCGPSRTGALAQRRIDAGARARVQLRTHSRHHSSLSMVPMLDVPAYSLSHACPCPFLLRRRDHDRHSSACYSSSAAALQMCMRL